MAMMQGSNKPKNIGKPTGGPPLEAMTAENLAPPTGMEGREEDLAKGMQSLVKTMKIKIPYPHDTNDALLKAHLNAIQFAKDNGLLQAYVEHDYKTMKPLLDRTKAMIEATGNKELALVMNFERTGCFFQMFLDAHAEPGKRSFTFPFRKVLNAAKGLGQFDLTEEEILDQWWRPRYLGYGKAIGVEFKISDMDQNGKVTVELAE
ncbi:MAG: hypothetical protein P8M55_03490 [Gammaproteobacteria bacterium]|jgi:hypothetical protein|nr:hypothetical protein [Gammaproteobacteria bacterium]MBT5216676.1 hypothetical protein [Gammaproteobacteria bacterium]MBT5542262.1 hypothetical protein [Gammaproteobacteria bacterium]MBT7754256.1 hypothetical protein [Gammaproteobacteria bacterium]MDG2434686.1 hypothetical protein [Gammaproteobacteria bacterium]